MKKRIENFELCKGICTKDRKVDPHVLAEVIFLAVEIAREGREGRRVGTLFVVGDSKNVLPHSRCLILDPLLGHDPEAKQLRSPDLRETVKELSLLDGAFVVSGEGIVLSACRYLDSTAHGIHLPLGLGTRHMAAASITRHTDAVAVVVSESSMVRVFDDGELIAEILPEIWLLSRHGIHLRGDYQAMREKDLTVIAKK